jgi:hypothetical protein
MLHNSQVNCMILCQVVRIGVSLYNLQPHYNEWGVNVLFGSSFVSSWHLYSDCHPFCRHCESAPIKPCCPGAFTDGAWADDWEGGYHARNLVSSDPSVLEGVCVMHVPSLGLW